MMKQSTLLGVMLVALWFGSIAVSAGAQQGGNSQGQQGGNSQGQQGGDSRYHTSAKEMTGLGLFAATLTGAGVYLVVRRRSKAKTSA